MPQPDSEPYATAGGNTPTCPLCDTVIHGANLRKHLQRVHF